MVDCKRSNHKCQSLPTSFQIETQPDSIRWAMSPLFWLCFSDMTAAVHRTKRLNRAPFWNLHSSCRFIEQDNTAHSPFLASTTREKNNLLVLSRNGGHWFPPWWLRVFPWPYDIPRNEDRNDFATMLSPVITSTSWCSFSWISRKKEKKNPKPLIWRYGNDDSIVKVPPPTPSWSKVYIHCHFEGEKERLNKGHLFLSSIPV